MFSNNNQISSRQIKRLLIFDLFSASSLLLPTRLAQTKGAIGVWSILAGMVLAFLYLWMLSFIGTKVQQDYFLFLQEGFGSIFARILYLGYAAMGIIACAWAAKLLADLVCSTLLENREFYPTLFLILLLAFYGGIVGLEVRARIYEILFWLLAAPLVIMLLLCVRQVRVEQWFPLWQHLSREGWGSFWSSAWQCFATFLPLSFLLFLIPHVQEKKKSTRAAAAALLISGLALAVIYLILTGIFGSTALAGEQFPIIILMGMVKIPGDFIKRLDTVMVGVWFFTLYALIAASLYYGVTIAYRAFQRKPAALDDTSAQPLSKSHKWYFCAVSVIVYGLAYLFHKSPYIEEVTGELLYLAGMPFIVLVPVLALALRWLRGQGKKGKQDMINKALLSAAVFFASVQLSGCAGTELENKSFPLAVLIEAQNRQYEVCYLAQNLAEVANEQADGENMTVAGASGSTYYETQNTFEKNNRCQLDLSHTKALIFQQDVLENGELNMFLNTMRTENTYARNTLVYFADNDMDKLAKLNDTLEVPLGSYLEQMTQNEQDIDAQAVVTLGILLNEQQNQNRTILVPVLREEDGLPLIHSYIVLQDFVKKGQISAKEAELYYLLENRLKQMDLQMDQGAQVHLTALKCKQLFEAEYGKVTQQLTITADAELITGSVLTKEIEKRIAENLLFMCQYYKEEYQADITDSYYSLPKAAPEIYRLYEGRAEQYRQDLEYQVNVQIRIL